jgi:protein-arginine kinase
MDFSLLSSSDLEELSDALAKLDKSTRIIGGYLLWQGNIKNLSFPGGLTKKTREECNTKIMSFLDPFVKEYGLNCYGIEDVEEVKKASYFIDLMAEVNKVEELCVDWPKDRKVFYNSSQKLVLLTNAMNHITMAIPLKGKGVSKDMIEFLKAFDSLVVDRQEEWEFTEKFGFLETSPADVGNGFTIKVALKLNPGATVLKYKPLADSKNVRATLIDGILHLEHKQKFKTIDLCIVDIMDLVSLITNEKDLKEDYEEDKSQVAEEVKSSTAIEYNYTITELLKEYEEVKTSNGVTAKQILSLSNPPTLIEGVESFNTFKKLYCHGAKVLSEGKFDLESFKHKASVIMEPLELPSISGEAISLEVSRNLEQFTFPAYIQESERTAVAEVITQALNSFEVSFINKV